MRITAPKNAIRYKTLVLFMFVMILLYTIRNLPPCPLAWHIKSNAFSVLVFSLAPYGCSKTHEEKFEKIAHFSEAYYVIADSISNSKITLAVEDQTWKTFIFYENVSCYYYFLFELFVKPDEDFIYND